MSFILIINSILLFIYLNFYKYFNLHIFIIWLIYLKILNIYLYINKHIKKYSLINDYKILFYFISIFLRNLICIYFVYISLIFNIYLVYTYIYFISYYFISYKRVAFKIKCVYYIISELINKLQKITIHLKNMY